MTSLTVALTGGIGSGKSTVARLLVSKGAVLVDADAIAREVVEPGGPAYEAVVERFGDTVLAPDGTIDRKALAGFVFSDPDALADLNAATHPAIGRVMAERRRAAHEAGGIVVLDIPLLRASHRDELGFDAVIVVDAPTDVAVERLVSNRDFDRSDARARVAAQASRQERLKLADYVIDNSGDMAVLRDQVDRIWTELGATLAMKTSQ
jgi:dephospho-CoA kinase